MILERTSVPAFTLIELLATLAITAVMVATALPYIFDSLSWAREIREKQTLAVLNDALTRYKCGGGDLGALTAGAPLQNVLAKLTSTISWNGFSHHVIQRGKTYHASSLSAAGNRQNYYFTRYGSYVLSGVSSAGLVGWWTFNEGTGTTAADSSGNGKDGTLIGNALWTTGKHGGALNFDGTDDLVDIGSGASQNLSSNYTISFWVKPDAATAGTVLRKSNSVSNVIQQSKYEIRVSTTNISFITGDGTTGDMDSFTTTLPAGEWSFVTCTLDNTNLKSCYKNGVLIGTATNDVNTSLIGSPYGLIGTNRNTAGNRFFKGTLDDMRIYSRVLSDSEILQLYQEP